MMRKEVLLVMGRTNVPSSTEPHAAGVQRAFERMMEFHTQVASLFVAGICGCDNADLRRTYGRTWRQRFGGYPIESLFWAEWLPQALDRAAQLFAHVDSFPTSGDPDASQTAFQLTLDFRPPGVVAPVFAQIVVQFECTDGNKVSVLSAGWVG